MLEMIFNRWRGTGVIFWKITGNMIYALYWFLLILLVSNWYIGLAFACLYVLGESYSWGKWVGYVCFPEKDHKEYDNKTGKSFPFIHYISNTIINQEKDYLNYCRLSLLIRGLFWFLPGMLLLYFTDVITIIELSLSLIILSFGFPVACELSKYYDPKIRTKYFSCYDNWETQEVIYGLFHFLGITLMVLL